jgi:phage shock protein PspC (stress-responsive transcriptional regulator)
MQSPGTQTFFRGSDRILGGVCSGLAEGFHVEALWVRLAFVVLTFINGVGVLLYVVLWVLMPERAGYRPPGQNVFESMGADMKRAWADLRVQFRGGQAPAASAVTATATTASAAEASTPAGSSGSSAVGEASVQAPPALPQPATRNPSFIFGAILVVLGVAFLAANSGFVTWSVIWPATLVALGVALLVRNLNRSGG